MPAASVFYFFFFLSRPLASPYNSVIANGNSGASTIWRRRKRQWKKSVRKRWYGILCIVSASVEISFSVINYRIKRFVGGGGGRRKRRMRKCWVHFSRPLLLNRPWASLGLRIKRKREFVVVCNWIVLSSSSRLLKKKSTALLWPTNNPPFEIIFYFKASVEPKWKNFVL